MGRDKATVSVVDDHAKNQAKRSLSEIPNAMTELMITILK